MSALKNSRVRYNNQKSLKERLVSLLFFVLCPFVMVLFFGTPYSYSCANAFLDVFLRDPMKIFIQNLVTDNLTGENRFFALKRKKEARFMMNETDINETERTFGRIIRKIDDNRFLVEVISPSGKLKQEEMTVELFIKNFVEDKDIPSDLLEQIREKYGLREERLIDKIRVDDFPDIWHTGKRAVSGENVGSIFVTGQVGNGGKKWRMGTLIQSDSHMERVFEAYRSRVKEVKIVIPENRWEEQKLREKGFGSYYIRGLDEVDELIMVAEQLRTSHVNPEVTHIDYFAKKVPEHIKYIREEIASNYGVDSVNMQALKRLEKYARKKMEQKGITHNWWARFNAVLSQILVLNSEKYSSTEDYPETVLEANNLDRFLIKDSARMRVLLSFFPLGIAMPTLKGKIGIIPLNKVIFKGIHLLGLTNATDGLPDFYTHDVFHELEAYVKSFAELRLLGTYDINRRFHDEFIEAIGSLPVETRKGVEYIYSLITREAGVAGGLVDFEAFGSRKKVNGLKEAIMDDSNSFYDLRELELDLSTSPSKEAVKQYFENIVDEFVTIAADIINTGFREEESEPIGIQKVKINKQMPMKEHLYTRPRGGGGLMIM